MSVDYPDQVRIYRPAKTAMQSGRGNTKAWILEYETHTPRRPEPLMGWTAADDTLNQVRLRFHSAEEAVAFAERKGWTYQLEQPRERKLRPRNYAQNFQYRPPAEEG